MSDPLSRKALERLWAKIRLNAELPTHVPNAITTFYPTSINHSEIQWETIKTELDADGKVTSVHLRANYP